MKTLEIFGYHYAGTEPGNFVVYEKSDPEPPIAIHGSRWHARVVNAPDYVTAATLVDVVSRERLDRVTASAKRTIKWREIEKRKKTTYGKIELREMLEEKTAVYGPGIDMEWRLRGGVNPHNFVTCPKCGQRAHFYFRQMLTSSESAIFKFTAWCNGPDGCDATGLLEIRGSQEECGHLLEKGQPDWAIKAKP